MKAHATPPVRCIVLVNSKISVSKNQFSYTPNRSIYTFEERFAQTLQTLDSVRTQLPSAEIVFIDNSRLPAAHARRLETKVDIFLNPCDDDELTDDTDVCPTKAVGELAQIRRALRIVDDRPRWTQLFKLCGRYLLNSAFDFGCFDNPHNQFKVNAPLTAYKRSAAGMPDPGLPECRADKPITAYFTSFYKIAAPHYAAYKDAVELAYGRFKADRRYVNEPLEWVLCHHIPAIEAVDSLGLTINCATEPWVEDV